MKKIILFCAAFFVATSFCLAHSNGPGDTASVNSSRIETLIINANVTVVLVDDIAAQTNAVGSQKLTNLVEFKRTGDTLIIQSAKNRNLLSEGIVYVPASGLRKLHINSGAVVRSFYFLRLPTIDVVVNGPCVFAISNTGGLNLIETEKYASENSTQRRPLPPAILPAKPY